MAPPKTFHGGRAVISIKDDKGKVRALGIFSNFSYSLNYDVRPVEILGNMAPVETVYVGQDLVSANATGWRVVGVGPHAGAGMPHLQELLTAEYLSISVHDRSGAANAPAIAKLQDVRITSYNTGMATRALSDLSMTFVARLVDDESDDNNERDDAVKFPFG